MNIFKKIFSLVVIAVFAIIFFSISDCPAFELTPEGEKLYKQWTELIGYSSIGLVKELDPAPEITEGLEITPENAGNYPGLKKLLPETILRRLDPKFWLPIKKMVITSTRPRYYSQEVIDCTKECLKNVTLNHDTLAMEGYVCGMPFVNVKEPLHLVWDMVIANFNMEENNWFDPVSVINYNKKRRLDSSANCQLGKYRCQARLYSDIGPGRHSKYYYGKGIFEIGSLLVMSPADQRGTATLRTRYIDVDKPDYFISYIPGLKRIRVLAGSDAQDPILGSEVTWDMWNLEWQKQPSKKIFPNEYRIIGEQIMLQPYYPSKPSLRIQGEQFYTKWEKRPVWVLEIISLDKTYYYSKRIVYVGKETFKPLFEEYYDRRGKLWRSWEDFKYMTPWAGYAWEGGDVLNYISERQTIMKMNSVPMHNDEKLKPEHVDMRWLIRMAR